MPYKDPKNAKRDAYFREYRRTHKKEIAEKNKKRYLKNREAFCEKQKPALSEYRRIIRAKDRGCYVPLTEDEKQSLLLIEKTRRTLVKETGKAYEIDHIIPISYGGLHHPINVRIVEAEHNKSKSNDVTPEAVSLAYQHYRLYHDRVGSERAIEFVKQLSAGLGIEDLQFNETTTPIIITKPTLEDFFT